MELSKMFMIISLVLLVSVVTIYQIVFNFNSSNWKRFHRRYAYRPTSISKVTCARPKLKWVNAMKGSSDVPLKVFPDVEVVVAQYRENLDWLASKSNVCHIYHKGNLKVPDHRFKQWDSLPNVGRESHTYLYHIVNNYDCLANITVFIQGQLWPHARFCYTNINDYVNEVLQKGFSVKRRLEHYSEWGRLMHVGNWKMQLQNGYLRKSKFTFGEFWEKIFGSPHPHSIDVCWGACFGVERSHILKFPKAFYENILSYVNDHVNPEEGHYVERLWTHMFS